MSAILFEHFHGAVTRVGPTTQPSRTASRAGTSSSPRSGPTRRRPTPTSLDPRDLRRPQPDLAARRWLNYLADDQADDAVRAAYGPNYDRLREVKRRYDPDNVFHLNHNIAP